MGSNSFGPYLKQYGCFTVLNISPQRKTLQIFQNPIPYGMTRDLLAIRGVTEADIRGSLLKGELNHKIRAGDIVITCSDVDLLQFNDNQKQFLIGAGVTKGLEVTSTVSKLNYALRQDMLLIGVKDFSNKTFYTPEKFLNGMYYDNKFKIDITHNGKGVFEGVDYYLSESGGAGTGWDTINFFNFTPNSLSDLRCSYYVAI